MVPVKKEEGVKKKEGLLHESPHACVEGTAGRLSSKASYALCGVLS